MISKRQFCTLSAGSASAACLTVAPSPLSMSAWAHKQQLTLSQVVWRPENHTLDVTHSFHIHEVETALAHAGIIARPDLSNLKARARLALYTAENFKLKTTNGADIPLELLGAEDNGRSVYVYQQAELTHAPKSLIVDCRLFRDLIIGQINNVDVTLNGTLRSLQFKDMDGVKKVLA